MRVRVLCMAALLASAWPALGIERPDKTYKIFQFPADRIPRIDGETSDWDMVPQEYAIGMEEMIDSGGHIRRRDPKDIDVMVRVGWVRGLNRLYFLYEAYDNYWSFARPDQHNDMIEIAVDGDLSGGPFIHGMNPHEKLDPWNVYRSFQGVHAQNWHIFTPAEGKDWVMVWGCQQPWIRELPFGNAASKYSFRHGSAGKLILEFWLTPFDYASCDGGSAKSVESRLTENKIIGMAWAVKDYDDDTDQPRAFWNLSPDVTMYGDASRLLAFRLMPLEPAFRKPIDAQWSFQVLDVEKRRVYFHDMSTGDVRSRKWDFGDGTTSSETNPVHEYKQGSEYIVVTLYVDGPAGKARRSKVFDVVLK